MDTIDESAYQTTGDVVYANCCVLRFGEGKTNGGRGIEGIGNIRLERVAE